MTRAMERRAAAWEPSPNIVHGDPVASNNPLAGRNPDTLSQSERRQLAGQSPTRAEKRRRVQAELEEESGYTLEEQEELARRRQDEAEYIAKQVAEEIAASSKRQRMEVETNNDVVEGDIGDMYAREMEQTMASIDEIVRQFQSQQSTIPEHVLQLQQQPLVGCRLVGYVPPRNVDSQYVFEQGASPTDENWTDDERFFPADAFPRNFYSDKEPIWFNTVPVYEIA